MGMDSKGNDIPNQYKVLQNAVDKSARHTQRQLRTINGNSYIGGFILLVLALGITYFINGFLYWVPAGFLLFYFLLVTGLRSMRAPFIHKDIKEFQRYHKEKHKEIHKRIDFCERKNLAILMQSLVILYLISFFILLAFEYNWIVIGHSIDLFIPVLTCLLFIPVPFFIKEFHRLFYPSEIRASLQGLLQQQVNSPWKTVCSVAFLKPLFFGLYMMLLLVLPLLSLFIISEAITQWPYVAFMFLMQGFMIVLFTNSFSVNTVRKELTTTITNYADLSDLISMAQIQSHFTTAEYDRMQRLYQSAKPYDFIVQDTFKFMNYYMLVPNRFHLKELLKNPREQQTSIVTQINPKIKQPSVSPPSIQKANPKPSPAVVKPEISHPAFVPTATKAVKHTSSKVDTSEKYKKIDDLKLGKFGILLYGPMLDHLSPEIKGLVKKRLKRINTPFKVELARKNDSYGGAPGLVPVSSGGAKVQGELLVFKDSVTERQVLDMLYRMENHLEGTSKSYRRPSHPTPNMFVIKSLSDFYGIEKVFYPSIGRNINQITPQKLAKLTIDSVYNTDDKDPDGFSYLLSLKKHGIITPMIEACEKEILHQTFSHSLMESRKKLEEVNTIKSSIE